MSSSSSPSAGNGGKRSRRSAPSPRTRKKQKRLDSIHDRPVPPSASAPHDEDTSSLRRSSRSRRVPEVLDSSPLPSFRRRNPNPIPALAKRAGKGIGTAKAKLSFREESTADRRLSVGSRVSMRKRKGRPKRAPLAVEEAEEIEIDDSKENVESYEEKDEDVSEPVAVEEETEASEESVERCDEKNHDEDELENSVKVSGQRDVDNMEEATECPPEKEAEASAEKLQSFQEMDDGMPGNAAHTVAEKDNETCEVRAEEKENLNDNAIACEGEKITKKADMSSPSSVDKISKQSVKEGRRCGLCGGGTDGKPPKKLTQELADSDNEAYDGSSASEEPNYDMWDGFGDEPGWLGKLLGPILDRFGIARIWVHQHCAVWSPEVYFAGLGCLKNIRAALSRGRALKCSRCGRPGATIGCRVDRCLKTYHLPCSRAEGCIFDHRKFLIACNHHRYLFQPQGAKYNVHIRKRKARKLKMEIRKNSNDAWRKDLEAEEKWLENCGEDEEFLKREGKRLHRDILRIAPTYIGGSSENGMHQGWESVAGLQDVIRCMKEVVILPLLYPDFFSNMGLTPPRGVLLHGYPGTGKTLIVRSLIGACSRGDKRIAYFARKGADCLGKYVGDAERQLRLLFQVAEKCQPSIIFFDEIDGLAPRRSRHQDQTHSSVVSTLLTLLDGLKSRGSVIVIGATNRPEAVDPALRRPGRFDREIYFPLPSEKDRSAILSLHTQNWPCPISGSLLSWVAKKSVGYAGADLQALCTQAAMIALKRNCALQDLLSSAEKGSARGTLPSLPSFAVEESDWLEALVSAPPPCSQREAGMAANDAVSSPLPAHLISCLLQPLLHLLISFYSDERIWLPHSLFNASKSIKRVIMSALEQKQLPTGVWRFHSSLIQEPLISDEIEKILFRYGLVVGPSVMGNSCMSDDDNNDHDKFDNFRSMHFGTGTSTPIVSMKNFHSKSGNLSGYRVLISGAPKSGQQHLASCLLHSFVGHIEILKINLATISQEGHGDLLRGLTHIFSKCVNVGRCMIYMPRIDLWAVNETLSQDDLGSQITPMTCESSVLARASNRIKLVTEMWNALVEQVNSMSVSASLIIMATCEMQNEDLPLGIRQFFSSDVSDSGESAPLEHTVPRFAVQIGGTLSHELVISSFSEKLLHDLVQHYIYLTHQSSHEGKFHNEVKDSDRVEEINSQTERHSMENGHTTTESCRDDQAQQCASSQPESRLIGHQEFALRHSHNEGSFPKTPSKVAKGSAAIAISTFGYQILRCPQFAELCWVTSKLREGPISDTNGPWKGWPFNSCVMSDKRPLDMMSAGVTSNNFKDGEHIGVVRGLVAVGLLAYKGVYTSVEEVANEVRNVSEILVGHIRAKVSGGKDKYHYVRILSQVAFLEDMVNNWAYTFQRSHGGNLLSESKKRELADNNLRENNLADKQSCAPGSQFNNHSEAQEVVLEGSSEKIITGNGHCVDSIVRISDQVLCNSDVDKNSQEVSMATTSLPAGDEFCRSEEHIDNMLDGVKQLNSLNVTRIRSVLETPDSSVPVSKSSSQEVGLLSNGLATLHSSSNPEFVVDGPSRIDDSILRNSTLASSKNSCIYNCCFGCLGAVKTMVRDTVSQCLKSHKSSTIDDIHDTILSCSSTLLAAFKKSCVSRYSSRLGMRSSGISPKSCACLNLNKTKKKNLSGQYESLRTMDFTQFECSCHLRNDEDSARTYSKNTGLLQSTLTFHFKNGILLPLDQDKNLVLHCKYEKLCLCSIVDMLLAIKES